MYREIIAANLRAYRARRNFGQDHVVQEMRALGFRHWRRQTLSRVEKCERRVLAEEIIGLAKVLETFPAHLLSDAPH